jgi:hypothetical protein
MIEPWRTSTANLAPGAVDRLKGKVFPSGRQALTEIIRKGGLGRKDRVAVPEWSSACVLGAVSICATPLLVSDLKSTVEPPAGVLVYDQWGWSCPPRREAIAQKWPDALLIHDTVDSADLGAEAIASAGSRGLGRGRTRLWSLSKVLGLCGGGVACMDGQLLDFDPEPSHRSLRDALEKADGAEHAAIDIGKSHVRYLPSALETIAQSADLFAAYAEERARRRANLDAVLASPLSRDWPSWMKDGGGLAGPGLCPIMRGGAAPMLEALKSVILGELDLNLPVYHFDYSTRPFESSFERCLALPLHGEVTPETIGRLARLVAEFKKRHAVPAD